MQAQTRHIPAIAQQWYQSKQESCFAGLDIEWSVPLCAVHLAQALENPYSYVAIEQAKGKVTAACGVSLINTLVPPYPTVVTEWLWAGKGRAAVKVLKECLTWGKQQGATLGLYAINEKQLNPKKFRETYQWKVL